MRRGLKTTMARLFHEQRDLLSNGRGVRREHFNGYRGNSLRPRIHPIVPSKRWSRTKAWRGMRHGRQTEVFLASLEEKVAEQAWYGIGGLFAFPNESSSSGEYLANSDCPTPCCMYQIHLLTQPFVCSAFFAGCVCDLNIQRHITTTAPCPIPPSTLPLKFWRSHKVMEAPVACPPLITSISSFLVIAPPVASPARIPEDIPDVICRELSARAEKSAGFSLFSVNP